jgi:hypothetical protein
MESKGLLTTITGALLSTLLLVSASFVSLDAAKPASKAHMEEHHVVKAAEKKGVKEHKGKAAKRVTKHKATPRKHYKAHKAGEKKGVKSKAGVKHHKTMKHARKTSKTHAVKHEVTPAHKS